jgi:hypothetical protein
LTSSASLGNVWSMRRRHLHALFAALALGLMFAMLGVGRARAADPTWTPSPSDTWQYQLGGHIDTSVDASVFDIDAFTTKASVVQTIHDGGRHAVCYVDAGTWETYRPDADRYPSSVLGKAVPGWPGERWVDIRRLGVLAPILRDRLDRCVAKGFDGVEYDWADSYLHNTGFDLTRADQLDFDHWLARAAHHRGLAVGLKNALPLIPALVGSWDFAVNEQCFQYHECWHYAPFLDAGKAVFNVEYEIPRSDFCAKAAELGISAIRKHLELGAWRRAC